MVAMWRAERIGKRGGAIKAAASQKGHRLGRILEESMCRRVTAAATDDEHGGSSATTSTCNEVSSLQTKINPGQVSEPSNGAATPIRFDYHRCL
jgi:hypothetical protein